MRIGVIISDLKKTKSSNDLFEIVNYFKKKDQLVTVLSNPESYYFEQSINSKFFVQGVDALKPRFNIFKIRSIIAILREAQFEHIFVADRYSLKILLWIKKLTDLDFRIHTFFNLFAKNRYSWIIRRNRKWITTINLWAEDKKRASDDKFNQTIERKNSKILQKVADIKDSNLTVAEREEAKQAYLEDVFIKCFPKKKK